ncbi:MAG: hypothetical protein OQK82_01890 [Candidatus Pacearchaeota archaeon]|nr:hypothetical protein [Candidatus Pacearchaeota archaeon]
MYKVIIVFLVFTSISALAAETHNSVPVEFQGKWSSELKYCNTDNVNNLKIQKNQIEFWESDGPILAVVTRENNEVAFIAELTGEGDQWLSFTHFALSSNKSKLTDITDPYQKNKLVRLRCK